MTEPTCPHCGISATELVSKLEELSDRFEGKRLSLLPLHHFPSEEDVKTLECATQMIDEHLASKIHD